MDTIDDTCLAISSFQKELSNLLIKNPHIAVYGLLQTLFVQQDAVNFLKISLFGHDKKIDWKKNHELYKIRQIRNETIGHPIKTKQKGGKSSFVDDEITSCTVDWSSLDTEGFRYVLRRHSQPENKTIEFSKIIKVQNDCLSTELELVMKKLQKEEDKHKMKFEGKKLHDLIGESPLYQVSLIYGFRNCDNLAWLSFDYYYEIYKKIKKELEKRYGVFGETLRIPGTGEVVKKLDFVFSKIELFKNTGKYEYYDVVVYVDALVAGMNELQTHLVEIDKEFEI